MPKFANALELAGAAGVLYGLWLVWVPLAWIVGGVVLVVAAQALDAEGDE